MDIWARCVATYVGLTVAFVFMAYGMEANGGDYPGNSIYSFIVFVRNFLLVSWVFTITFAIYRAFKEEEKRRQEALCRYQEEQKRKEQDAENRIRWAWENIERKEARLKELEERLTTLDREREKAFQERLRELEEKQARTPEAAVDTALQDFG